MLPYPVHLILLLQILLGDGPLALQASKAHRFCTQITVMAETPWVKSCVHQHDCRVGTVTV